MSTRTGNVFPMQWAGETTNSTNYVLYHECLTLQLVDVTIRFMEITCKNNEKECTIIGQNTFEIEKKTNDLLFLEIMLEEH